ncbi:MAG: sulfolipid-1 biosynthesis phthioceranic/hydroxyphthioceranic acid synthase [Chloroflexota bacterium]
MSAIAVVGIGCRLPGGIDSPDRLWEALLGGVDLVAEVPADRWDVDALYDAEPGTPGRSVSRWGAFLDDPFGFDYPFFGIGEREARAMDPQHRLLLEVTWEAAERSGRDPRSLAGARAGVFFGLAHQDYAMLTRDAGALGEAYSFTGTPFSMASGRVAHALGLRGPAVSLDTACSSSLVAVHTARRSLLARDCDVAFAGGVMLMFTPTTDASASGLGMLSPTGRCRPFDAAADGFVRAEACGVVMLKRREDAERDGDRILALIRGSAVNQDGRTHNILAPSRTAQVEVIERALDEAGVDPASVGLVEAHGTGTPVGDTEEYGGLAAVYGRSGPVAVGSVKSNLGHAESAAGAIGLIKAVLSLDRGVAPGMVHHHALPAHLASLATGLHVPTAPTALPTALSTAAGESVRRAGVSSYGMSGTNAHAVIESAPAGPGPGSAAAAAAAAMDGVARLFPISASSPDALRATADRLAAWLADAPAPPPLDDLAHTLATRRGHRTVRAVPVARSHDALLGQLRRIAADGPVGAEGTVGDGRGPVFVFSGQGSQWDGMGAALLARDPVFAATVAEIEPRIAAIAGFSVTAALRDPGTLVGIDRIQPAIFTFQVALAAALRAAGVVPSAVIGHSLGEVSAAVVAGAIPLADGIDVICHRALLCRRLAGLGAMAAVELAPAEVRDALARARVEDVEIAVIASPTSTVIGGDAAAVRGLVAAWQAEGRFAREVAVDVASHTAQVEPILAELAERLASVTPAIPRVPLYATALLDPRETPVCDAAYWVENLRHPVRFRAAVATAIEDGHRVFLELAPHALLTRAVLQNAAAADVAVRALPSLARGEDPADGVLGIVAALHATGAGVDLRARQGVGRLLDAPLPAWTHHRLVLERATGAVIGDRPLGGGGLLGVHRTLHEEPERHVWAAELGLAAHPWLADHEVHGVALFPGAGYAAMAIDAAHATLGPGSAVHDLRFDRALRLEPETPVAMTAVAGADGGLELRVESAMDGAPAIHATATLRAVADPGADAAATVVPGDLDPTEQSPDDVWDWWSQRGVRYGRSFRAIERGPRRTTDGRSIVTGLRLPAAVRRDARDHVIHPVLLDAACQTVAAFPEVRSATGTRSLLLLGIRTIAIEGPVGERVTSVARLVTVGPARIEADVDLLGEDGTLRVRLGGVVVGSAAVERDAAALVVDERLLGVAWRAWEPLPAVAPPDGRWIVVRGGPGADTLGDLGAAVGAHGHQVEELAGEPGDAPDALADRLRARLSDGPVAGVVLVVPGTGIGSDDPATARQRVGWVVRLAQALADAAGRPRLVVVTRAAQAVLPGDTGSLEHAGIRGLTRVIGAEVPALHPTLVDVAADPDPALVARLIVAATREDEIAVRGGSAWIARLERAPLGPADRRVGTRVPAELGVRIVVRTPGDLASLEAVAARRRAPGPGEVEIAVDATSVNFADVLVAMGRYPSLDGRPPMLGLDVVGRVTACGAGVTDVRVGDRVGGIAPGGCWASFVTGDARLVVPIPATLSDAEAAAVLTAGATAWLALDELARIGPGDRVLIHSATGGVGRAAVAIARAAGARIFATAGSDARRALLRAEGIEHVYDSRTPAFAAAIRRDTDGAGVDIVLNSLTGPAQQAGISVLAPGGRFVEIGKKDIYGGTWLGLAPFRRNLSFFAVDLALLCTTAPDRVRRLIARVFDLAATGRLPLDAIATLPLTDAAAAVRMVGAAAHIGKLVLTVPRTAPVRVVVPPEEAQPFRGDRSYVVSGGLGGLGLVLAERISAGGGGRIVLGARSATGTAAMDAIGVMRARGTEVEVVAGDLALPGTAGRLVDAATATGLPLHGVVHAAAVVEDGTLGSVTDALLARDWAPKVEGAWQLHEATREADLGWFCSFSSVASLLGSPGQAAYAAANSWLDGFTRMRRAHGLPATSIAWAAWGDVGAGAHLADRGDTRMITPAEGADAFERILRHDRTVVAYAPIEGTPWLTALAARSPFASGLRAAEPAADDAAGRLRALLATRPREEWPRILRRTVVEQLAAILRRTVDPDGSFHDAGLDSLGTVLLLTALEAETGVRLPSLGATTADELGDRLALALAGVVEVREPAERADG